MTQDRRRHRRRRAVAVVVAVAVLAAVVTGGTLLLRQVFGGPPDYPGPGSGEVVVVVHPGDTASVIAATLAAADVVKSEQAFVDAASADQASRGIQPGYYRLRHQMAAVDALSGLLDPASRVENRVTVQEGLRLDQTVGVLAKGTGIPASEFTDVLRRPASLGLPAYARGGAEGFLFPATYTFGPDATAGQVLRAMVDRFHQAAADTDLVQAASARGITPRDAVIIASLVQAEVPEADFGRAARVVYNRLAAGMPLQFDSTVNYALKSSDITLTLDQLGVDSPYNTYKYPGLPPGPINSPGEAALRAALAPPAGSWLYFVTVNPATGETKFTSDYQEFLRFKQEFVQNVQ